MGAGATIHIMADKPIDWRPPFLRALRAVPVIQHACDRVGINRSNVARARQVDPEFEAEFQEALEAGIDAAEAEAYRRAVEGWHEPVIDKGRLAYAYERQENGEFTLKLDEHGQPIPLTVNKKSDRLLEFVLVGRRRGTYGNKQEISGPNGAPLAVVDETKKAARVAALLALAKERQDVA